MNDNTETTCTSMNCSRDAEYAYWVPDLGDFSRTRNPELESRDDGDLSPYVCESCRDRMASTVHWDADRFVRPEEKIVTSRCEICNGPCEKGYTYCSRCQDRGVEP